ncbi:MAG TPA: chemotaxis protein CheX [Spirochaetota bacterium]|nr:chemotaxis protein CheX [Spirochaetota bacterium]HPC39326.1 chemotaxis protein CheX [Spirochaetota bacterium]HPL15133.1 chemotaxis protein CheX [Spirochaetota bacterium]HQF08736.1 chemotaxis protein CheX [Spirochaetota bacterium]HQH97563.1 chemotaxis protein CheX [Spirochaetota bacterium]
MIDTDRYSRYLVRSVNHIFKNFLGDTSVEEVFETQSRAKDPLVVVEINGTMKGEIIINLPKKTLDLITQKFINSDDVKTIRKYHGDVAGELANLITGTFANQMQFLKHDIKLNAPEFNDDPISIKTLYENINLSFNSKFGGFDIDFYFKEMH